MLAFLFCLLQLRCYKAKCVKTCCLEEWVGHLEPKFEGEGVVPGEYFFRFYKTRHILLSNSANCTVLRVVILTQYRRVTDGQTDEQTDGIAVASTALALRRAVKSRYIFCLSLQHNLHNIQQFAAYFVYNLPHYLNRTQRTATCRRRGITCAGQ